MSILSLQGLPLGASGAVGAITGAMIGVLFVFILVFLALYVYLSLAYSKIGKKTGITNPGVAWMPGYGILAVIFETAKAHWWPFLVLTFGIALSYPMLYFGMMATLAGLMGGGSSSGALMTLLGGILIFAVAIVFSIMTIVWHWKTYEAVGRPGWWILIPVLAVIIGDALIFLGFIVPAMIILGVILLIIGGVVHLVLIGIAAWSGGESRSSPQIQITNKRAR